jgi:hypothetical protein
MKQKIMITKGFDWYNIVALDEGSETDGQIVGIIKAGSHPNTSFLPEKDRKVFDLFISRIEKISELP